MLIFSAHSLVFSDLLCFVFQLEQKLHGSRFKKVLPPIQNAAAERETVALIEQFEREIVQTPCHRPDTA